VNLYGGSADKWSSSFLFVYSNRDQIWQLVKAEETGFRITKKAINMSHKKTYKPPRDFGKISINEFDPFDYLDKGEK